MAIPNCTDPERAAVVGRIRSGTSTGDVFFAEINGTLVHIDSGGRQLGQFSFPGGTLSDVEQGIGDDLYVGMTLDSGSVQLLHLDYEGNLLGTIELPGGYAPEVGLDVAADGSLWVTHPNANQVHHLDASGDLLATYPFSPGYPMDAAVRGDGQVFVTEQLWWRLAAWIPPAATSTCLPASVRHLV